MSAADVCHILKDHGSREVRRKGSHIVMQKRDDTGTTKIPVPDHSELRLGTLRAIIRQSGLARSHFEA
jgi:predicted RNA binding protein YcfA (HicA-like mRNA interferase family)